LPTQPGEQERVLPLRITPDGWAILRVHYDSIPDYDYNAATEGLTEEQVRQELEIDWLASSHKRVYPQFGEIHIAKKRLRPNPRGVFYTGWDFGNTPAFVITQLNPYGQWMVLDELVGPPDRAVGIYEFAQDVADLLFRRFAQPFGLTLDDLDLRHFGDPYGNQMPAKGGGTAGSDKVELRSAFRILRDGLQVVTGWDGEEPICEERPGWGWRIQPGAIPIKERLEAIRARLSMLRDGAPMLIVDPECQALIEGFMGAYHYPVRPDGQYGLDPEKNWWSHVQDALQYPATRIFAAPPRQEEDEDAPAPHEFRSHGAGRR
jgi:hypothetical protein